MREITEHKVNPANDRMNLHVIDEPGSGGAHHDYLLTWTNKDGKAELARILFQNGPIAEAGVNGCTHEILLAILIDRLECFQRGAFANDYNAAALEHLRTAQGWLFSRTRERMSRGVEGTHTV